LGHRTHYYYYYYYYYYYFIELKIDCYPAKHTKIHISHHAQLKHSTQSYTNNKGHITHNEYGTEKSKAIPVTGCGGL
jgi:hypothetical protein